LLEKKGIQKHRIDSMKRGGAGGVERRSERNYEIKSKKREGGEPDVVVPRVKKKRGGGGVKGRDELLILATKRESGKKEGLNEVEIGRKTETKKGVQKAAGGLKRPEA